MAQTPPVEDGPRAFFTALASTSARYSEWLHALRRRAFLRAGVPQTHSTPFHLPRLSAGLRFFGDGLLFGALMAFLVKASERAAFTLWLLPQDETLGMRLAFQAMAVVAGLSVWLMARFTRGVRPYVEPPSDVAEGAPLEGVERFVQRLTRGTRRLRRSYGALLGVVLLFVLAILGWSVALVFQGFWPFARVLGGSLAFATSFVCVNWRPWVPLRILSDAEVLARETRDRLTRQLATLPVGDERADAGWRYLALQLSGLPLAAAKAP